MNLSKIRDRTKIAHKLDEVLIEPEAIRSNNFGRHFQPRHRKRCTFLTGDTKAVIFMKLAEIYFLCRLVRL